MKFIRNAIANAKAWWKVQTLQTRREIIIGGVAVSVGFVIGALVF